MILTGLYYDNDAGSWSNSCRSYCVLAPAHWLVVEQDYAKTTELIITKLGGRNPADPGTVFLLFNVAAIRHVMEVSAVSRFELGQFIKFMFDTQWIDQ